MGISDIYADKKVGPGLLSTPGRVLLCLMDDIEMTRLSLALLLGVSESAIDKAISALESDGLLKVSRNGRKSRYNLDMEELGNHPDYKAIMEFRNNGSN